MLNNLKKAFEIKEENKKPTRKGKEDKLQLQDKKQALNKEVIKLKEYETQVGALLPFEEKELLEKEIKLLNVKKSIVLNEIEETRKAKGVSPELDNLYSNLNKALAEKKKLKEEVFNRGRSINLCGGTLDNDPRETAREELFLQDRYKKAIELIDEQIKLSNKMMINNSKITEVSPDRLGTGPYLITITKREVGQLLKLKKEYEKKANKDWQAELDTIEKDIENIRAELVKEKRIKEEYAAL